MGWADHVRGALIALALVAHGIYALPFPEAIDEEEIEEKWRQRAITAWRHRLSWVGIQLTQEALETHVVDVTTFLAETQRTLKTPFRPFFQLTNTNQAWALFAAATTRPERLVVEIRRRGRTDWEPVLRKNDPCCSWREDQFRFRRLRGVWDGQKKRIRPGYRNLVKWVARRAFEDFPDAVQVRTRLERGWSRYPWREPRTDVEYRHERSFIRGDRRLEIEGLADE